jgi:hypothetical protein
MNGWPSSGKNRPSGLFCASYLNVRPIGVIEGAVGYAPASVDNICRIGIDIRIAISVPGTPADRNTGVMKKDNKQELIKDVLAPVQVAISAASVISRPLIGSYLAQ